MQIDHLCQLCLKNLFCAAEARLHRRIHDAAFDRDSEARCRKERILLCVNTDAQVVTAARRKLPLRILAPHASPIETVLHSLRHAVIPSGDNPLPTDYHRGNPIPGAVCLPPNGERHSHVVVVVGRRSLRIELKTHCFAIRLKLRVISLNVG